MIFTGSTPVRGMLTRGGTDPAPMGSFDLLPNSKLHLHFPIWVSRNPFYQCM